MFEFTYKLKNKDYLEYNDYHYKNSILHKVFQFIFFVIFPMILYIAIIYDQVFRRSRYLLSSISGIIHFNIFTLFLLLILIVSFVILYFILNLIWKIMFTTTISCGNFVNKNERTIRFDSDNFTGITDISTYTISYEKINELAKTKKAIYIYINLREAVILPVYIFKTAAQKDAFWEFINDKLSTENKSEAAPCMSNEDPLFQFNMDLTKNDFMEFELHITKNNVVLKNTLFIFRIIIVSLPLFFLLQSIVRQHRGEVIKNHVIGLIIAVIIIFCWKYLIKGLTKLYYKSMEKKGKLPYEGLCSVSFYETIMTEVSDGMTIQRTYKEIKKIEILNQVIYLYISDMQAVIIPLHIFKTEEQKEAFITFIQDK